MRSSAIKALITALILEAASLGSIGIGYAIGEWNHKSKRTDHFLIDVGGVAHAPGGLLTGLMGFERPSGIAISVCVVVNLLCWFISWFIVYEGLAGVRARWKTRRPASN